MKGWGIFLLVVGLIVAVIAFWMFYEAHTALGEIDAQISAVRDVPIVGPLAGILASTETADARAYLKQVRSRALLIGLGGVAVAIVGIVLAATATKGKE